ncbi:hypothetical protein GOODEAATRI_007363, partial [Goodea atripinnis]
HTSRSKVLQSTSTPLALLVLERFPVFCANLYLQGRDNDRDHKVRLAIGNGVRAEVWREFLNRFGNIKVLEFYASTEGNVGFLNYAGKIGAVGRVHFLHQKLFPYILVKYDTERDGPMRDANGLCIEASKGE